MLPYYLEDCEASLVIASDYHSDIIAKVNKTIARPVPTLILDDSWSKKSEGTGDQLADNPKPLSFYKDANAMILYTSGTTGKPKGVLLSHMNLDAQIRMLIKVWEWTSSDVIVNPLPLHHTHGVVNALLCPLYVGAR